MMTKKCIITLLSMILFIPFSVSGQKRASAKVESARGLHTAVFESPEGKITVHLPDDLAAGDTVSGTVIAEPSGETEQVRHDNADTLSGYVIEVEKERVPANSKSLKWTISAAASSATSLILKNNKGREIARTNLPVAPRSAITRSPTTPAASDFTLPGIGQAGRPIQIFGPFDGDFSSTSIEIGGQEVAKLAESPRKVIGESPRDILGATDICFKERGVEAKGAYRNVGVRLTAPKTTLLKGEQTTLTIRCEGLKYLTEPVEMRLENATPSVVRMQGGETQTITIGPSDVLADGTFTLNRTLDGVSTGSFVISSTILAQAEQDECRHVVTEEITEWGDWHKDKDGTQWREGKIFRVTRCADGGPNNNKVLKKEEIGKAREVKKRNGSSTVTKRTKGDDGDTVTQEEKDKKGNTTKSTTAEYDKAGKVKRVTENKGGKTTEWKKEGDKWYKKKGDSWEEYKKGPETIPEFK